MTQILETSGKPVPPPSCPGRAAQEQDLIALSRHLRVSQLATSVRECMLPVLPWFTEDHLLPIFTTIHRRYGSAAAQKFPHLSIPNSWVAARKTAVPGLARGEFEEREWFLWRVPLSAVAEMLEQQDAKSEYCSDWFYSKGAYFRANLVLKKPQMELRAEVSAKLVKNVPALDVQLLIRQSRPDVRGRGLKILDKSSVLSPKRRTCAVVAPPTTELMPVLQRQLVDGHLVFKIKCMEACAGVTCACGCQGLTAGAWNHLRVDETQRYSYVTLVALFSLRTNVCVHFLVDLQTAGRPGQQLEAAQRQHADLCKLNSAKVVTLHTILLGVGGTSYTEHTLNQLKRLGLDQQCAIKLANKLHAHPVQYAHKLVTAGRAIENKNTSRSQVMGSGASNNPPDPQ
eukprot:1144357-Pelagomonas_calceolata.AAC.7